MFQRGTSAKKSILKKALIDTMGINNQKLRLKFAEALFNSDASANSKLLDGRSLLQFSIAENDLALLKLILENEPKQKNIKQALLDAEQISDVSTKRKFIKLLNDYVNEE